MGKSTVKKGKRVKGQAAVQKLADKLEHFEVTYEAIDSITPNSYNPNRQNEHDYKLLIESMKESGFTQPILVQRKTREIVDGEHRWRAATQLGYPEIPCIFVDMTKEEMRVATLRHNRARGDEDFELVAIMIKDFEAMGQLDYAQEALLLDDEAVRKMLEDVTAPEELASTEYGKHWIPGHAEVGDEQVIEEQLGNRPVTTIASDDAQKTLRERKIAVDATRDADEKVMIAKAHQTMKINFVVTKEEHVFIRKVLGENPVKTLLEICHKLDDEQKAGE